jgi:peptidoglycan/LPS O-acetylase OafA/YrhL
MRNPVDTSVASNDKIISPRATTEIKGHLPALDGVRGLAIAMVLMVHFIADARPDNFLELVITQIASYGTMGVDLFFVLSGFLITGILFDSRAKANYFRGFYMRRVLRIFPLYYGVLFLFLVVIPQFARIEDLEHARAHQAWLWAYSANIFLSIAGNWEALPMFSHMWSLAVEEHFYFFWPLVVYLCDGPMLKRVSLTVGAAALLLRVAMVVGGANQMAVGVLTPARLDALALGGYMAVVAREAGGVSRLGRMAPKALAVTSAFIVATFVLTRLHPEWRRLCHEIRQTGFAICFCAILVFALTGPKPVRGFFESRTMRFFGKYSYGLYVFHFLFGYFLIRYRTEDWVASWVGSHTLAIFVQAVFGTAFAIVVSLLSYHLFEKHFLKLKDRFQ